MNGEYTAYKQEKEGERPPSSVVRLSVSSLISQMLEVLLFVRCRWMQELLSCLFVRTGQYSIGGKPVDPGGKKSHLRN